MLGIFIGAVVLLGAMYVVGRHEAEFSIAKTLMIAAGVSVLTAISSLIIGIFAILVAFGLCWWAVNKFCYLGVGKSAAVAGIYVVASIGIEILFALLTGRGGAA